MSEASLVVVGSGIKFVAHLTHEARAYIEQSDLTLYLVNEPAMKAWIKKCNPRSESLDTIYSKYSNRLDCYKAISDYILLNVRQNKHVCVVLYGHPSVFSKPGLDAVKQAIQEGFFAKILPGISAEACLFADLLIDPGTCGCQSFEATNFLIHRKQIDTSSHLILWQVDAVGITDHSIIKNEVGTQLLLDYLVSIYNKNHSVIIYEAAQYPGLEPRIEKILLKHLPIADLSPISTLYIPPSRKSLCDESTIKNLNIYTTG
jgi:tetrapyrrole methylase family protein/MazG family protein